MNVSSYIDVESGCKKNMSGIGFSAFFNLKSSLNYTCMSMCTSPDDLRKLSFRITNIIMYARPPKMELRNMNAQIGHACEI